MIYWRDWTPGAIKGQTHNGGAYLCKSAWKPGERRVVPIPPGEPAATIERWEAIWRAVGAWDGPDLDDDVWGEVQALYVRLVRYGVPIRPECAAMMRRWEELDTTDLFMGDEDSGH